MRPLLHRTIVIAASLMVLALIGLAASHSDQHESDDDSSDEAEPKLTIDQEALRDTIVSLLRDGKVDPKDDGSDNGYTEAAQEYLEYMQSLLGSVKSPSEVYVREQLADLETLDRVLAGLDAAASGPGGRLPAMTARLLHHLVKGPARQLLAGAGLDPATSGYEGSDLAGRVAEAAGELRRFLAETSASLTDDLRRHSAGLPAGRTRDYLDAVLDRVLELEGKKVRLNVQFPDAGKNGGEDIGEPLVSRVPDDEEDKKSSTEADADDGGRSLFDQVLGRRAAESVAERLLDGGPSAAAVRIEELRRRRYQPAGMAALLEAIEQCLKLH